MDRAFALNANDVMALQSLLDRERQRLGNVKGRPKEFYEEEQTPDIYVARTPSAGIAALDEVFTGTGTGTEPPIGYLGFADCRIFRIVTLHSDTPQLEEVKGLERTVYNLSASAIAGDSWVLIERDKFGSWFVSATAATDTVELVRLIGKKPATTSSAVIYAFRRAVPSIIEARITFTTGTGTGAVACNELSASFFGYKFSEPATECKYDDTLYHINDVDLPVDPETDAELNTTGTGEIFTSDSMALMRTLPDGSRVIDTPPRIENVVRTGPEQDFSDAETGKTLRGFPGYLLDYHQDDGQTCARKFVVIKVVKCPSLGGGALSPQPGDCCDV